MLVSANNEQSWNTVFLGKIKDVKSLQRTVAESAVESKAKVIVWRDKKEQSFTVKLGELEKFNTAKDDPAESNKDVVSDEVEIDKVGLRLLGLNKETRAQYNIDHQSEKFCLWWKTLWFWKNN